MVYLILVQHCTALANLAAQTYALSPDHFISRIFYLFPAGIECRIAPLRLTTCSTYVTTWTEKSRISKESIKLYHDISYFEPVSARLCRISQAHWAFVMSTCLVKDSSVLVCVECSHRKPFITLGPSSSLWLVYCDWKYSQVQVHTLQDPTQILTHVISKIVIEGNSCSWSDCCRGQTTMWCRKNVWH